ncbi:hypothetical protein CCACVL1_08493 [Corchorus capsularis]|uniref:Uncharacterized protein n=1 Tax=Corchorus capsularis TaxID=210143 RepID=A0A1R3J0B4_COCAP|nr:hypothetical protein CCACVL1_08493 [Corchorus capsularis]
MTIRLKMHKDMKKFNDGYETRQEDVHAASYSRIPHPKDEHNTCMTQVESKSG